MTTSGNALRQQGRRYSSQGEERRSSLPPNASVWDRFLWDFKGFLPLRATLAVSFRSFAFAFFLLFSFLTLANLLAVEDMWGSDRFKETERLKREVMDRLLFLSKDDTVGDLLSLLTRHGILSAPVYDDDANMYRSPSPLSSFFIVFVLFLIANFVFADTICVVCVWRPSRFVGSVDVLDLVTYCVKQMGRGTLIDDDAFFKQTPVGNIVNISGRNRWTPIDRRAPLRILLDTLSLPDVHRVPIVDNKGTTTDTKSCQSAAYGPSADVSHRRRIVEGKPEQKVIGLVTQSQVLRWLWDQREKEGFPQDILQLKLKDWKSSVICGTDMLWLVEQETSLAEAFRTIKRERVTGVGVVNAAGELVGNVSASDIKVCVASGRALIDLLTMSLERFLQLKGSLMVDIDQPLSHRHSITATPDDTMDQVLDKLITHRIHRLWIVDSARDEEPGTASPSDQPVPTPGLTFS